MYVLPYWFFITSHVKMVCCQQLADAEEFMAASYFPDNRISLQVITVLCSKIELPIPNAGADPLPPIVMARNNVIMCGDSK